jgi:hypothetical protein
MWVVNPFARAKIAVFSAFGKIAVLSASEKPTATVFVFVNTKIAVLSASESRLLRLLFL